MLNKETGWVRLYRSSNIWQCLHPRTPLSSNTDRFGIVVDGGAIHILTITWDRFLASRTTVASWYAPSSVPSPPYFQLQRPLRIRRRLPTLSSTLFENKNLFGGKQLYAVYRIQQWWKRFCCRLAVLLRDWIEGLLMLTMRELDVFLQVNMWRMPKSQKTCGRICVHEHASSPRCCLCRRPRVIRMASVVLQRRQLLLYPPPTNRLDVQCPTIPNLSKLGTLNRMTSSLRECISKIYQAFVYRWL